MQRLFSLAAVGVTAQAPNKAAAETAVQQDIALGDDLKKFFVGK